MDDKSSIAVFEPIDNGKYKMSSREWRENDEIIISGYIIDGTWYDLVWFNGAPAKDYSMSVVYYDENGNAYE